MIFQSYRDGVWMWQEAQCSLLDCCLTEISRPRHLTWYSIQSHYTDTELTRFLALLSKCWTPSERAANTIFKVFGMTRLGIELATSRLQSGRSTKLAIVPVRECVEYAALKEWKLSILRIVNKRISFYCQNTKLLPPKPKTSLRHLKQGIQEFHRKYILAPADKAANNVVVVWRLHYINTLKQELGGTKAFELQSLLEERTVVNDHTYHSAYEFALSVKESQDKLSTLNWLPKLHTWPYKARFSANSSPCTTTER